MRKDQCGTCGKKVRKDQGYLGRSRFVRSLELAFRQAGLITTQNYTSRRSKQSHLTLHVFFFCECSFFSYDIVVSFDCLSRRGNASATCMRKILLSYCGSVSLPSILLQSTDQRGLGGLVDFRQAKGEREHEQRGEQ